MRPRDTHTSLTAHGFALPAIALVIALALALLLGGGPLPQSATSRAAAQGSASEVTPQSDNSVPRDHVVMIGSSPLEAPNETWGIGQGERGAEIVRYASDAGWSIGPGLLQASGQPLAEFEPVASPLAGSVTPGGSGVLLGSVPGESNGTRRQVVLVRDRGGAFQEATLPQEGEVALKTGESVYDEHRAPLSATLDEASHAGALVVPVNKEASGVESSVLHWDGNLKSWTREAIEVPEPPKEGFRVLAIAASPSGDAWLLAQLSSGSAAVALFHRHASGKASWKPVVLLPKGVPGEPLTVNGQPFTIAGEGQPPTAKAQILTVSNEGIWVDGRRQGVPQLATIFFKPAAEGADSGQVLASWCNAPEGTPACDNPLPDALPASPSRSFAWADPSNPHGFGQRVITGLPEGVSLRLEGSSFKRVPALGGSETGVASDVGGTEGAAFTSQYEGWLGKESLPVHLTLQPAPNRMTPYPVPFHHALLAVAAQPGAAVGSLSSQALAVGTEGEVARYTPGEGWQPETLLGAGGRRATPTLRAVAWPTSSRAYAVGELGQMWLWRGETGLWEPDPAAPTNFRGDVLGIAFDPNNPSRGYAVGQQGVLLRYGKSWTQEALPSEVQGASFTSIAFAGSQALVAYRIVHFENGAARHTGGVLVNDGSGWRVDGGAAAALGRGLPWAVAGLPDGGAGISSTSGVLERNSLAAAWQPAPRFVRTEETGSLALFREGGELRAIASGGIPETLAIDSVPPPPAGFPPNLIKPYPPATGYVLRQTATGWSDEEHDLNNAGPPPGELKNYDTVYKPDPTSAVLIDPTGVSGWAVGGEIDSEGGGKLDTADIARYPADGVPPPGFAAAAVPTNAAQATFAIGGGAQCAAPCADRANARVGPDVWLTSALAHAGQIQGVRAFFYTGPRLTTGETSTQTPLAIPYKREFARYSELLGSSSLPAFGTASLTDHAGAGSECPFEEAFASFPKPFGEGVARPELTEAGQSGETCASGQRAYYALDSTGPGGKVRVVVLDDASGVDGIQLAWLQAELGGAAGQAEPAIVVGNADLNAQIAGGVNAASAVAQILVAGHASAYFYDSVEQNVGSLPLNVAGGGSVPTFGSGTLGYINSAKAQFADFIGHSGFLLVEVNSAARDPGTNRAPVTARLIPNIGELALEAQDGVLLHRSQPALFAGLARRPRAGGIAQEHRSKNESSAYIPIPANCVGTRCANGILPEYTFSSSRPDIGNFVKPNLASPDPHAVLLAKDEPISDPKSGLFCAYNAGTTTVTITAGGISSSLTVTVQAGSVRRPCGTQPLKELPSNEQHAAPAAPPPPAPAPAPAGPAPTSAPTPVPLPAAPPLVPAVPARPVAPPHALPPFIVPAAAAAAPLAFVPLPIPTPARPTPPSGTSAVTSPIEVAEHEEEEEEATESVSNQALAYHASDHEPQPLYVLGLIVLAAFAGASVRRRPRRGRRELSVAPATVVAARTQRRWSDGSNGVNKW